MKISVSDHIHLSEFQPSDQAAVLQQLKEMEIYDRTGPAACPSQRLGMPHRQRLPTR